MSVNHRKTSVAELNRKKEEAEQALLAIRQNEALNERITDLQLALCDVFERLVAPTESEVS